MSKPQKKKFSDSGFHFFEKIDFRKNTKNEAMNLPKTFANDTDVWDYVRVWLGALDANVGTAAHKNKKNCRLV